MMQDTHLTNLKGYEIIERLGTGGFGAVYRAKQTTINREVAIKFILPSYANQPEFIRRFETEAQLVARLEHPHITPLIDYWRDPQGAYLVMRYLRGGSVRDALDQSAYDLDSASRLLDQIASALAFAHRNDVIHRDIKPANILLDEDGNAYLADFGIAKDLHLKEARTQPDAIMGSLPYISPEQARSEPITHRSDIYSLGVMLFEMITGEHPFKQASHIELFYKHINDPLPLIDNLPDNVREAINEIIQKATAKDPAYRYPDVLALAIAFRDGVGRGSTSQALSVIEQMTMREHEILQLIADGLSNQEIAEQLFITLSTVKWHVNQLYRKLGVRNRVQAIVRAREMNLIFTGDGEEKVQVAPVTQLLLSEPENPYKGLHAFQAADSRDFFGRDELVEKLIRDMGEDGRFSRFLAVIGPSGSGKSSLVKAGLMPALAKGGLPGSEKWFVIEMLPGERPVDELEIALIRVAANHASHLHEQLMRDEHGLLRAAELILPKDDSELVVVVDQFEELFTLVKDESVRQHFLNLLRAAVNEKRSRVRVVVTLRADYYDKPLHYPEFGEMLKARMETVLPLSAKGLERAIVGPAERVGVTFQPGLVAQIVSEMTYQAGALPLLQYALTELFDRRKERLLTHGAYQEIGGAVGALAHRADEIYLSLTEPAQELTRQIFLRLVTLGEGAEDTRRRVERSELLSLTAESDTIEEILDTYASHRLLALDHDEDTRRPTVEVAHEAILREWERLRQWLNDSREDIRQERILAQAADAWHNNQRDLSYLLSGTRLEQIEKWQQVTQLTLTPLEREFIDTSSHERSAREKAESERQAREIRLEQRSRNFLRGLVAVLLLATIGAFGLTGIAIKNANEAQTNLTLSTSRELAAASVNTLGTDPERSLLLALQAVKTTYNHDGTWTSEAEEALHRAVGAAQARLVLRGHSGSLTDIAYSPDGTHIATSSLDGTTRIWDAATGEEVLILRQADVPREAEVEGEQNIEMNAVVYNPDGTQLTTGSRDGTVVIWDAASGQVLQVLRSFTEFEAALNIASVAYSPDGTDLAMLAVDVYGGSNQWAVKVWDLANSEVIFSLDDTSVVLGTFGTIRGEVAFSPDGAFLAVAATENVTIWNLETNESVLNLIGHTRSIDDIAFNFDGTLMATTSDDGLTKVWDISTALGLGVATMRELYTVAGSNGVAFSPDGTRVVTGSDEGVVKMWDARTGTPLVLLAGHEGIIRGTAYSPDGVFLATAGADNTARIWRAAPGEEVVTFNLTVSATGGIGYNPDGTRIAVAGGDSTLRVYDSLTGEQLLVREVTGGITGVAYSPDGNRVAAVGNQGAWVLDASNGEVIFSLVGHEGAVDGVEYSPDGTLIATGGVDDATVRIWDAATGELVKTLIGHTSGVHCLAYSPDGRYVVSGGDDKTAIVWDLITDEPIFTVPIQSSLVTWVDYNADGTRFATASLEGAANVWDAATGELVMSLSGHAGSIGTVRFSEDGTRILTTGGTTTKIWDASTGQELLTLYGHTAEIGQAVFSPDGEYLASNAFDDTIRVYVLRMEDLIALTESRITRAWTLQECQRYLHVEACPPDL